MKVLLKDLVPGDVFEYVDQNREYRRGKFRKLRQPNCYLKPSAKYGQIFVLNLRTNEICNHRANLCTVLLLKTEENNMENKMGHFEGWAFGVPVRVYERNPGGRNYPEYEEARLVNEDDEKFAIMFDCGDTGIRSKQNFHYECIPYQQDGAGPVYPVCQDSFNTAYFIESCKQFGAIANSRIKPTPIATLNIDGKTIELSAETTAELKKKLGV